MGREESWGVREEVGQIRRPARGLVPIGRRDGRHGSRRTGRHLLAEDGPDGHLTAIDAPGNPTPGPSATTGPSRGSDPGCRSMATGSASRSRSQRHRAMVVVRSRRSRQQGPTDGRVGRRGQFDDARAVGQPEGAAIGGSPHTSSIPGMAVAARWPNRLSGQSG